MVSIEYSEALTEIDFIIKNMDKMLLNKIPKKFKDFVSNNKSATYDPKFDYSQKLNELKLKEKTKDILSVMYMNFLCNDTQKIEYTKVLKENSLKQENELREKYNPDVFKDMRAKKEQITETEQKENTADNNVSMIEYKEGIFTKIINKIKSIFNR